MTRVLAAVLIGFAFAAQAVAAESVTPVATAGDAIHPRLMGAHVSEVDAPGADIRCLLPPRLTRLGRHATVLAPSRAIKTDAVACRQRGGTRLDLPS